MSVGVLGRTVRGFTEALAKTLESEMCARQRGLLQALDPRVKLVGLLALVVSAALSRRLAVMAGLFGLGIVLALASRLSLWSLAKRVWLVAFGFTFMIAAPALFLTPGDAVYRFGWLVITAQGVRSALMLVARVETTVTLSTLLVLTTPWMHLLKALRTLLVPVEVIMLLAMTHRYVVLLTETANAMFEARRSRVVGRLTGREQRRLMVNTGGVLLSKTLELGNQVHMAMLARGFRGEVRLLHEFRLRGWDYLAISGFAVAVTATAMAGR
jgi:cobalt/nickel transport system permease protein